MSEEKGGIERRQFPRIEVKTNVNYAVVVPALELGNSKDISQGGLCLHTKRKLTAGTIIRLEFDLPGDKPQHIEALGRVCWQRSVEEDNFATGIKFLT
jgi:hypothetical protein